LESEEERKDFVIRVCSEVLSYIDSPTELAMYAKRLHMQTGFDEMVINQETQRAKRLHQNDERRQADINRHNAAQSQPQNSGPINAEKKMRALVDAERLLFVLALNYKVCADILIKNVKKEDFMEGIHRDIAEVILNGIKNNAELSAASILGKLGDSAVSEMAHALEMPYDSTRTVEIARECLFKMHENKTTQQISEINRQLKDPMLNRDKRSQLMKELLELRKQKTAYDVKGE
jgi:DNA primase